MTNSNQLTREISSVIYPKAVLIAYISLHQSWHTDILARLRKLAVKRTGCNGNRAKKNQAAGIASL